MSKKKKHRVIHLPGNIDIEFRVSEFGLEEKVIVAKIPRGILHKPNAPQIYMVVSREMMDDIMIIAAVSQFMEKEQEKPSAPKYDPKLHLFGLPSADENWVKKFWNDFNDPPHFEFSPYHAPLPPDIPNCRCVMTTVEPWSVRLEIFGNTDPHTAEFRDK